KQDDLNLFAFQTLIGLILSPAVSDEAVIDAMKNLASKGLFSSIDALANASVSVVLSCLAHLNYNNKKAGYIIDAAKYIVTNCNSKVPRSFEKLQEIRGVGEKVAALTLLEGFDDDSHAIYGIDSHMYKLFRTYLNWVDIEDTTITMMAIRLKTWLPQHYWKQLNPIFSGLGQLF
ncbi:DNA glycosylase, partial [Fragilariopsis cylindrus CCMP1102]